MGPFKCPECGAWWAGPQHFCPPVVTTNTTSAGVKLYPPSDPKCCECINWSCNHDKHFSYCNAHAARTLDNPAYRIDSLLNYQLVENGHAHKWHTYTLDGTTEWDRCGCGLYRTPKDIPVSRPRPKYPTYDEYKCPDHPDMGWFSDWGNPSPWHLHRQVEKRHEQQATNAPWRTRPYTEYMEKHTQLLGYPEDVHWLLKDARKSDPYK